MRGVGENGTPGFVDGLSTLGSRYEALILDLWGVVHDGIELYPGALEALRRVRAAGLKTMFVSNAPRRADRVIEGLNRLGVSRDLYDGVVSSGEVAFGTFATLNALPYYFLGRESDAGLLDGLRHHRVAALADAHVVVCGGLDERQPALGHHAPLLAEARSRDLPMHCINPDEVVVKQDGEWLHCAGAIASCYAAQGGEVIWYGKPYQQIYRAALALLGAPDPARTLAVGDGLDTDILGAQRAGLDSVLVTGGILRVEMGNATFDPVAIRALLARKRLRPLALLRAFAW